MTLVGNDLFLWEIRIPFDAGAGDMNTVGAINANSSLGRDFARLYRSATERCVVLRYAFEATYPFAAPFVRVRSPRFLEGSSNVMTGGALCVDTFTGAGWVPSLSVAKTILAVQSLLLGNCLNNPQSIGPSSRGAVSWRVLAETELEVKLDPVRYRVEYTEAEGRASYAFVLSQHPEWSATAPSSSRGRANPAVAAAAARP